MINGATNATDEEQVPLIEAVQRLVRGGWDELESSILTYGAPICVKGTRSIVRCHCLRSDASDRQIPEITRMAKEAARLFTQTQVKTGEGAELLLYALLEKELQIPQILSKMSLKTSTEMQYHGADGVHAKLLDNGDLAVYWGEAKLYESVTRAMTDCMDSIAPYLLGTAHAQDIFLIRHYADAGNAEVTARLLEYFNDNSVLSANVEMRGACLIGFVHENYPKLPREEASVKAELDKATKHWAEATRRRLGNHSLTGYAVEVFFFPMPSVEEFRKAIKAELGIEVRS